MEPDEVGVQLFSKVQRVQSELRLLTDVLWSNRQRIERLTDQQKLVRQALKEVSGPAAAAASPSTPGPLMFNGKSFVQLPLSSCERWLQSDLNDLMKTTGQLASESVRAQNDLKLKEKELDTVRDQFLAHVHEMEAASASTSASVAQKRKHNNKSASASLPTGAAAAAPSRRHPPPPQRQHQKKKKK